MTSSSSTDPKVTIRRSAVLKGMEPEDQFCDDFQLSEGHMDKAKRLIGDGQAEVSVGTDMGEKDYGNGFGVFVSVKLTCNQDVTTIEKAQALGWAIAKEFTETQWAEAKDLYQFLAGS